MERVFVFGRVIALPAPARPTTNYTFDLAGFLYYLTTTPFL